MLFGFWVWVKFSKDFPSQILKKTLIIIIILVLSWFYYLHFYLWILSYVSVMLVSRLGFPHTPPPRPPPQMLCSGPSGDYSHYSSASGSICPFDG